jgi:hypothetical protein
MDYINIGIIGGNKCGKKTFMSAICANDTYNNILIDNFIEDFTGDYIIPNIIEINYENENFIDVAKQNIDLYIVISKNGILDVAKLDIIKNAMCENKNGNIIMLHNKFDDDCKYDNSIANSYEIDIYSLFLHNRLYYVDNNDTALPKTITDLKKLVRTLIGDIDYKKNKNKLETLFDMQNYLQGKECNNDIYNNAMHELGYHNITNAIKSTLSENYGKYFQKHIELKINSLNNNNNLMQILDDINIIINCIENNKTEHYDDILLFINNNTMFFINNNLVQMLNYYVDNPINITTDLINKLCVINKKLLVLFSSNILVHIIDNLKNLRKENLIDIFKNKFDFDLMKEINGKLTNDILQVSLDNTIIDGYSFESFLLLIDNVSVVTNNNIDYIALVAKYFNKFIKNEHKIFKYDLTKKLLNEKDKRIEFILWQIFDNIKQKTNIADSNINVSFESFKKCNKLVDKFYDIIVKIFNEPNTIEKICDYFSDYYEYDFYVLAITEIINSSMINDNLNIKETFKKILTLHENDELEEIIIDEKNKIKDKIVGKLPSKYAKFSKFINENYALVGDKKESLNVNFILEEFKIWHDNNHTSKFNFNKKDAIEFFEHHDGVVEIKKDIVNGLKKIKQYETEEESSESSSDSDDSEEVCSNLEKQKNKKNIIANKK